MSIEFDGTGVTVFLFLIGLLFIFHAVSRILEARFDMSLAASPMSSIARAVFNVVIAVFAFYFVFS